MADHTEACDGGRCPCYVQGQFDVIEAIKVMRRLGMSYEEVMSVLCCADDDAASVGVGPEASA